MTNIFPLLAQTHANVTYDYQSLGFVTKAHLKIHEEGYLYTRNVEKDETTNENGITFYSHKDYLSWFLSTEKNKIYERSEKPKYTLNSSWMPEMEWEILDETMEIGGYQAQKAVTKSLKSGGLSFSDGQRISYEADKAIAWFATDLPFSAGPERYYGLPGLIVKLEYEKRKESCTLTGIDFLDVEELDIPPTDGIQVSKDEIINTFKIDKKWLKKEMKKIKASKK